MSVFNDGPELVDDLEETQEERTTLDVFERMMVERLDEPQWCEYENPGGYYHGARFLIHPATNRRQSRVAARKKAMQKRMKRGRELSVEAQARIMLEEFLHFDTFGNAPPDKVEQYLDHMSEVTSLCAWVLECAGLLADGHITKVKEQTGN